MCVCVCVRIGFPSDLRFRSTAPKIGVWTVSLRYTVSHRPTQYLSLDPSTVQEILNTSSRSVKLMIRTIPFTQLNLGK